MGKMKKTSYRYKKGEKEKASEKFWVALFFYVRLKDGEIGSLNYNVLEDKLELNQKLK